MTVFHRMRVDHEAAPAPAAPPGVTVHTGPGDEQFRRTAHTVLNESFAGHYGWHAKSFDDWHQTLEQDSTFDWTKLVVADLGVLPAARGRGIAKHLLRTAFRNDFTAGPHRHDPARGHQQHHVRTRPVRVSRHAPRAGDRHLATRSTGDYSVTQ